MKSCLLIVGALHLDELADVQGTPVLHASNPVTWRYSIGGVAANAALSAAQVADSDSTVALACAVGTDSLAQSLTNGLRANGIDVREQLVENAGTGRYTAIMDNQGELLLGLADVDLARKLASGHVVKLLRALRPDAVLLDANLSVSCLHAISDYCSQASITLAAMAVSPVKALKLLGHATTIDLLFCNRREAVALTNTELDDEDAVNSLPIDSLADALQQAGFVRFVLTDGKQDILVQSDSHRSRTSVPSVIVHDHVNGAGDALAGACFAAFANQCSLVQALRDYGLPQARQIISGNTGAIPVTLSGR